MGGGGGGGGGGWHRRSFGRSVKGERDEMSGRQTATHTSSFSTRGPLLLLPTRYHISWRRPPSSLLLSGFLFFPVASFALRCLRSIVIHFPLLSPPHTNSLPWLGDGGGGGKWTGGSKEVDWIHSLLLFPPSFLYSRC